MTKTKYTDMPNLLIDFLYSRWAIPQLRTTTRNIFEKAMEEDASDNEIPQVPGSVGSANLACTMARVSTPAGAGLVVLLNLDII